MSRKTCKHGMRVCSKCYVPDDAAKRISDAINLALIFKGYDECRHGWMAFALADGSTDHTVYPSKKEAVKHQSNEYHYYYLCLEGCLAGANPRDCGLLLEFYRDAADSGILRQIAGDDKTQLIKPLSPGGISWS